MVQTPAFKSFEITKSEGEVVRFDVGMSIKFATESGVIKEGTLIDVKSSKKETKLEIQPNGEPQTEKWSLLNIVEDSLEIVE